MSWRSNGLVVGKSDAKVQRLKLMTRTRVRVFVCTIFLLTSQVALHADTVHEIHFKGTDAELDVYTIKGAEPGPTLLLQGGIQGDEPGGYLAADLYADLTLRKGNLIVVPRANFFSIVENSRGALGDMNRKFAGNQKSTDRDLAVITIIKELMKKSDFFLNLHDGSGFYADQWESPVRNPQRFGQSIIADTDQFTRPDGKVIRMQKMVQRVLEKVNQQISSPDLIFRFNNHRTLSRDTLHKEQRLSATYHALTQVGIPAFGIETSKEISDYRIRVRHQTMVVNAFLEEFGIIPDTPRMYLDNPCLKYLIVSINGRTPIVLANQDVLKVQPGDTIRIIHIESNYSRGITARIQGQDRRFNDLDREVTVSGNTNIELRKDRFLMARIPVETARGGSPASEKIHFEPRIQYFCVKVNDKTYALEPGEELSVIRGDNVVILDPRTNRDQEDEKAVRVDLRGFQADSSAYNMEDRGHRINTGTDLQEKYGQARGRQLVFPLQAKLNNKVFGESYFVVTEPRLEYLVLKESQGGTFVVHPDDKLALPENTLVEIVDVKTNSPEPAPLLLTMSGRTVRWQETASAGIDSSKLTSSEIPLDITRYGRSLGRIWLKQGKEFQLTSSGIQRRATIFPVRYR